MSKELEALDRLIAISDESKYWNCDDYVADVNAVKQALQELQAIKEAKPSEALNWLEKSKNMMIENNGDFIAFECLKVYSVCKQTLLKAQEQEYENKVLRACIRDWEDDYEHLKYAFETSEKVFKIIKEKPFESASAINYIKINNDNPKMLDYEHYCMTIKEKVLEEEFDLLKEMIG